MKFSPKDLPEKKMFPSETAGNGRIRANSARTGAGQGKGSPRRMVRCAQCGFLVDMAKVDHSGGTMDGNGGYGPITKTVESTVYDPQESGTAISANQGYGDHSVKKNAGCPHCGSKNFLGGK